MRFVFDHIWLVLFLIIAPFVFYGLKKPKHRTRVLASVGGFVVLLFVFAIVGMVGVLYFCFKGMEELYG